MFRVTAFAANGLIAKVAFITIETFAFKGHVHAAAINAVRVFFANRTIFPLPPWMACAHSWHSAFSVKTRRITGR